MTERSTSAEIHSRLNHPVIDADGHWIEFEPMLLDYLDCVAGPRMVDRFRREDYLAGSGSISRTKLEERRSRRLTQPAWWGLPTRNSLDRATAMLPRLMYERLEEMGLDFAIVYPDHALFFPAIRDYELQLAAYRAYNLMAVDLFRDLGDRLMPVAGIPMNTPGDAIEELDFVNTLGLKAILMRSLIRRPIPGVSTNLGDVGGRVFWPDTLGLDSEYDYEPVWAKCVELKLAPTFHTASQGIGTRVSYSNYVYNHIGHFAAAGEAVCKSLFLGGVTRRFPSLRFGFLEGGVGWACMLYNDLINHWKKRNIAALQNTDPANLNLETIAEAFLRYGTPALQVRTSQLDALRHLGTDCEAVDDFGHCGIRGPDDIRDLFVDHFYFGCETDDPITAWAFRHEVNAGGVKLRAMMGSDIGHFDVVDMTNVLVEAYSLVERRLLDEEAFRDFVFGNAVRLWGRSDSNFFKGTVVEKQAAAILV